MVPDMTAQVTFRRLGATDISMLEEWFRDPELSVRMGGMLPLRVWFERVRDSGQLLWVAQSGDEPVGVVIIESDEHGDEASLGLFVAPWLRSHGFGRRVMNALAARAELGRFTRLTGKVEFENSAALRSCLAAGFVHTTQEPDADGMLTVVRELTQSPARVDQDMAK